MPVLTNTNIEIFAYYKGLVSRKKAEILDRITSMELLHPEPSEEYLYIHSDGAVNCIDDSEAMPIYQAFEDTSSFDTDELRDFAEEQYEGFLCFLSNMAEVFND